MKGPTAAFYIATLLMAMQPIACRGRDQSVAVKEAVSFLIDSKAEPLIPATPHATCSKVFRTGIPSTTLIQECILRKADSLTFSYSTDSGEVLLRGRVIYVADAMRLVPFADSVDAAISSQFGQGVDCLKADPWPYTKNFKYWRRGGRTLFLRATVLPHPLPGLYPGLELQNVKGDRTCDMFLEVPGGVGAKDGPSIDFARGYDEVPRDRQTPHPPVLFDYLVAGGPLGRTPANTPLQQTNAPTIIY
jgi:hypothetical protein